MTVGATLEFHGAAGEVTGSCTLLVTPKARILVDFGMFMGSPADEARNAVAPSIDFASLDAVICTHAHIDHCGRLGMLPSLGFRGKIYATTATHELLGRVLRSSARLQRGRFYERANGTAPWTRALLPGEEPGGAPEFPPAHRLYDIPDVRDTMERIEGVPLGREVKIAPLVSLVFHNAGHIPGAAITELTVGAGANRRTVVFSGDLGPDTGALLARPARMRHADVVVVESTNGERRRDAGGDPETVLEQVVADALARKEKVLAPCFALGRAQLLVHRLARLHARGLMTGPSGGLNVYVDSPMAVHGIESLYRHPEFLEPDLCEAVRAGGAPLWFPELHYVLSKRESMAIDRMVHGGIVLAGSGFMDAGPITRHLEESIDREDCTILLSGYQPEGGFAWKLQRGADRAQFNGRIRKVRARCVRVEGLSGHADQDDLVNWFAGFAEKPGRVVINHGVDSAREALAARLRDELGLESTLPAREAPVEI